MGKVQRTPGASFQEAPPLDSHRTHSIPSTTSCDNTSHVIYHGSSLQTPCPGILLVAGHMGSPLPSTYKDSRLPEGKQVFSIKKYCLYNKPPLSENGGTLLRSKVPAMGQPCRKTFVSKAAISSLNVRSSLQSVILNFRNANWLLE